MIYLRYKRRTVINLNCRRLYPVIYFPALLLYSLSNIPPTMIHQSSPSATLSPLQLSLRKHRHSSHLSSAATLKEKPHPYLERMNLLLKRFQIFPIHSVAIPLTIQFLFSTFVAFLIPALISYLQYGDPYLKEAILYHFGRFFTTYSKILSITLGLTQSITSLHSTFGYTPVRLTAIALVVVFCSQLFPQPLR